MRILIVDDSPTFLSATSDALEGEGFEVETARNGAEGVQMARNFKPDLIIMDIEMPVMKGTQAVKELRNDPDISHIPVIAMTSVAPESLGEDRNLFNDYLVKPFGFDEMIPKIKRLKGSMNDE